MSRRQRILPAFFVAFIALKSIEGLLRLESWSLTHNPMFSGYILRNAIPHRIASALPSPAHDNVGLDVTRR
jgi:hypothetical protein